MKKKKSENGVTIEVADCDLVGFPQNLVPLCEYDSPRIRVLIEILYDVLPLFTNFFGNAEPSQKSQGGLTIHLGARAIQIGSYPGFDPSNLIQRWKHVDSALQLLHSIIRSEALIEIDEVEEIRAKWLGSFEI